MDNEDTDPNMNENKDYIDLQLVHGFSQSMKSLFTGLADATKQTQQGGYSSVTQENGISNAAVETVNNISKTLTNATLDLLSQNMKVVEKSIVGDYATMSPEDATRDINEILTRQKNLFINLSENEELQKSLQEWIKSYAEIGIEAIRITKPSIDEIVEEFWNSSNSVLVKSSRAIINIGINVGKSAVATIPIAGGGIVLFISFIQGINEGMLAAAPAVKATSKIAMKTKTTGEKLINKTQDKIADANKKYQDLEKIMKMPIEGVSKDIQSKAITDVGDAGRKLGKQTIENMKPSVPGGLKPVVSVPRLPPPRPSRGGGVIKCLVPLQKGGRATLTRKKINKQITHVTRRIVSSLNLFNKSYKKKYRKSKRNSTIKKKRISKK
tara:strand:+ start:2639 stop:3787 length:1149 start_codon:yes stop_codon:yes gene_type:complete